MRTRQKDIKERRKHLSYLVVWVTFLGQPGEPRQQGDRARKMFSVIRERPEQTNKMRAFAKGCFIGGSERVFQRRENRVWRDRGDVSKHGPANVVEVCYVRQ